MIIPNKIPKKMCSPLVKQMPTKFLVMKPTMMIGATHIEVHIRRGYKQCMCHAYTKVVLASPSMCRHGLGNTRSKDRAWVTWMI
jgi:hypothetical protein